MSDDDDSRRSLNETLRQLAETPSPRKKKKILNAALNKLPPNQRDDAASWIAAWRMTQTPKKDNWERIAVFATAIAFLGSLIAINIAVPNPTPTQSRAFNTVLALMAAGFGAFVPGAIAVRIGGKGFLIRAASASAFFVIVYFWKPA